VKYSFTRIISPTAVSTNPITNGTARNRLSALALKIANQSFVPYHFVIFGAQFAAVLIKNKVVNKPESIIIPPINVLFISQNSSRFLLTAESSILIFIKCQRKVHLPGTQFELAFEKR
jgi:hypothetical protein